VNGGRSAGPFARNASERILRITLHSDSFASATGSCADAINLLRQFSRLDGVLIADTIEGSSSRLIVDVFDEDSDYVPIRLEGKRNSLYTGIFFPRNWIDLAKRLSLREESPVHDANVVLGDLLVARAHRTVGNDLLVTLSPWLLLEKKVKLVYETNPCTPTEAVKILALYLRSRGEYIYEVQRGLKLRFDKGLFYWILARHRLPRLWKYFSACVLSEESRLDDTMGLGHSILVRCTRALQARDQIGTLFYCPQDKNTRDDIMYHFDYLTLLLSGALDALARVARRAYKITKPREYLTSFRSKEFVEALRNNGAGDLAELVASQRFVSLMTLIYELRNTIHGSMLRPMASIKAGREQESFVAIDSSSSQWIWDAAECVGSAESWGLTKMHAIALEPYSYATTAVSECFRYVNSIARKTDVTRLFPPGNVKQLSSLPADDDCFRKGVRKRVHLLG
jgi:hypothetical protein